MSKSIFSGFAKVLVKVFPLTCELYILVSQSRLDSDKLSPTCYRSNWKLGQCAKKLESKKIGAALVQAHPKIEIGLTMQKVSYLLSVVCHLRNLYTCQWIFKFTVHEIDQLWFTPFTQYQFFLCPPNLQSKTSKPFFLND